MKYLLFSFTLCLSVFCCAQESFKPIKMCTCKPIPGPEGPQGFQGPIGPQGDQGAVGSTGAQGAKGLPATGHNFSVFITAISDDSTGNTIIGNYLATSPFYTVSGFDLTNGTYTVPVTGRYTFKVIVNYKTNSPAISHTGNPRMSLFSSASGVPLISGSFPKATYSDGVDTSFSAILGSGQVVMAGDFDLVAGQQVYLVYEPNGAGLPITFGLSTMDLGIIWSGHSL